MNHDASSSAPRAAPAPTPSSGARPEPGPTASASSLRETVETVVFVVVLVLLLKTFVAEAFVIPTGSMATTLWGDQKWVECPQCAFEFPVNCSSEREPQERGGEADPVVGCTCPNCRYRIDFRAESIQPACRTGDRVIVSKYLYDLVSPPQREDVVVFKYPKEPQRNWSALNYIKRLVGRPGETIGIRYGDLYVYPAEPGDPPLTYAGQRLPDDPADLWLPEYMYERNPDAMALFERGSFKIIRKAPAQVLALRRIVYDNDHPPRDLVQAKLPPRWAPEADSERPDEDYQSLRQRGRESNVWVESGSDFVHAPRTPGELAWLRYRHLVTDPPRDRRTDPATLREVKPSLITDFLGYNTYQTQWARHGLDTPQNWVGDLMLEFELQLEAGPGTSGQLVLELVRGVDRTRATWDVGTGACTLSRISAGHEEILETQPTHLKGKGKFEVRFANVDERLLVWVDGKLPFGDGVPFPPPRQRGPWPNDLRPAGIALARAGATVRHLKLWRDTYYTARADDRSDGRPEMNDWSDPRRWDNLHDLTGITLYVQPDHFLCLGDNSPQSADSRIWGLVPRRLMLGRALLVYYPLSRMGAIR